MLLLRGRKRFYFLHPDRLKNLTQRLGLDQLDEATPVFTDANFILEAQTHFGLIIVDLTPH